MGINFDQNREIEHVLKQKNTCPRFIEDRCQYSLVKFVAGNINTPFGDPATHQGSVTLRR